MRTRLSVSVLAFLAILAVAAPASATFGGRDGWYAFDVYEGSPSGPAVYVCDPHGTDRRRVFRNALPLGWSRDGVWLLMIRRTATVNSLWRAKWNGSGLTRIPLPATVAHNLIDHASWAPDGRHIAFSFAQSGRSVIYTMRTDGKELKRIAVNADWPTWSGNGWIGFRQMQKNNSYLARGLTVMRPDGTHVKTVTQGRDSRPSFSPDGKRLLFNRLVERTGGLADNKPAVVTVATRSVHMINLPPFYHPGDIDPDSPPVVFGLEWAPSGRMFYSYSYLDVSVNEHTVMMSLSSTGTNGRRLFQIVRHSGTTWMTGYFYQGTHT